MINVNRLLIKVQLQNIRLKQVEEHRYLGTVIDNKVAWKKHVQSIFEKIVPWSSVLRRRKDFINRKNKMMIHHAFRKSHLRRSIIKWPSALQQLLEKLQRQQHKVIKMNLN